MIAFQNNINNVRYTLPDISLNNNGDDILPGRVAVMKTIGSWSLNANGFLVRKSLWSGTSLFLNRDANWMDADDVSNRERFEKQVCFMQDNNIDLLSCDVAVIDENDLMISVDA